MLIFLDFGIVLFHYNSVHYSYLVYELLILIDYLYINIFKLFSFIKVAFNNLERLGPIDGSILSTLEDLDVGVNPLTSWSDINYLGTLPL